jgi:hypothetical protein
MPIPAGCWIPTPGAIVLTIDLRAAILAHRAVIEAAGEVNVADDASAARAALKHAADLELWAHAEAAPVVIRGLQVPSVLDAPANHPHHSGPTVPGPILMDPER